MLLVFERDAKTAFVCVYSLVLCNFVLVLLLGILCVYVCVHSFLHARLQAG